MARERMSIIQRGIPLIVLSLLMLAISGQGRAAQDTPTYAKDVAPILRQACVSCHNSGKGSGPFPLLTYNDARRRARQIVQVTESGYMPPWQTVTHGLQGERGLTEEQKTVLKRWADGGLPEGEKPATPNTEAATGTTESRDWPLGAPDRVVSMPRAYTLPSNTLEPTRCFVIPTNLTEDRALRAIVLRPSNPRAVRYATLYLDTKGEGRRQEELSGAVGYFGFTGGLRPSPMGSLADWSPGAAILPLPPENAIHLPKGADLILEVRFHPTGKPEIEKTEVGLYFATEKNTVEPVTLRLGTAELYLPKECTAVLTDTFILPADARVLEITPNAHFVTRTLTVTAQLPDGKTDTLLDIRDWDANWKQPYRYQTPPNLPAGTRLTLKMEFNNTDENPRNPWKPSHRIVPGLEFMEEMASVWVRFLPGNSIDQKAIQAALPPVSHHPVIDIDEREPEGKQPNRPRPGPPPASAKPKR